MNPHFTVHPFEKYSVVEFRIPSLMDPIIQVWRLSKPRNFSNYEAGSWGPREADEFMQRDNRRWRRP